MRIDAVSNANVALITQPAPPAADQQPQTSFSEVLQNTIGEVNQLQSQADTLVAQVAGGDLSATHQAMIAMEKASLALDLTVQVRNKALEAYQELMRTPV